MHAKKYCLDKFQCHSLQMETSTTSACTKLTTLYCQCNLLAIDKPLSVPSYLIWLGPVFTKGQYVRDFVSCLGLLEGVGTCKW
jgi:hypothetical protein